MDVEIHKTYYSCFHNYTTQPGEILAVVDYWEHKANLRKNLRLAKEAVYRNIKTDYGENVAATGEIVLVIPKLIIKFKIS